MLLALTQSLKQADASFPFIRVLGYFWITCLVEISVRSLIHCAVHPRITLVVSQSNATSKPRCITSCYLAAENHSMGLLLSASWWWAEKHLSGNTFFWRDAIAAEDSLIHSGCYSGLATKDCHLRIALNAATFNSAPNVPLITPLLLPPVSFLIQWS